jgi:DNA-directed RNA polymerase specialized sigma24 family protein
LTDAQLHDLTRKLTKSYGEDAAQEGIIRLVTKRSGLTGLDAERFARRCAHNAMVGRFRRERRQEPIDLSYLPNSLIRVWPTQLDRAIARQTLERLDGPLVSEAMGYSMNTDNSTGRGRRFRLKRRLVHVTQ